MLQHDYSNSLIIYLHIDLGPLLYGVLMCYGVFNLKRRKWIVLLPEQVWDSIVLTGG